MCSVVFPDHTLFAFYDKYTFDLGPMCPKSFWTEAGRDFELLGFELSKVHAL